MLTPADFIFNGESSPYVELNYDTLVFPGRYASYGVCKYTLKVSDQSATFSKKMNIENRMPDFQSYNLTLAQNAIKELNLATATRSVDEDESLLFPGVRHLSPGIILFERPPAYKVVSTYNDYRDSISNETSTSEYYLPIPWQVYIAMYNPADMRLVSVKMFFASNSLSSLDQTLYSPPLYNFYSDGTLCRPFFSTMEDIEKYPKDLSGIMASAYDWIWNSGFNFDITQGISFFLHSNKYKQFEKYLSPQNKANFDWLNNHYLYSLPTNLPLQYHNPFFRCWEEVPLSEVSKLSWNSFTETEFFYQHLNNLRQNLIAEFCSSSDIEVHEDHTDEEYHNDDCPSNCSYLHEIQESEAYLLFVSNILSSEDRTVLQALEASVKFLKVNRINIKPNSYVQCNRMFSNILQNSLPTL
jgi:hypothetical protein